MEAKQSNLCVAADFTTLKEVIQLADTIGPKIAVLKIHVDIFDDFDASKIQQLKAISQKHNFLIMEDRYELNCLFVFYHLNFIVCVVFFLGNLAILLTLRSCNSLAVYTKLLNGQT